MNKNSFDYIACIFNSNDIAATNIGSKAFESLREAAFDNRNENFSFSKGNIFEFIEGAKLQINDAKDGFLIGTNPVNASRERGQPTSIDDISYINRNGEFVQAQCKFSEDPNYLAREISKEKYFGFERWIPSDKYDEVKNILNSKLKNGTISDSELDALRNLKKTNTSTTEIESLGGKDGHVDLEKVNEYIRTENNKLFLKECLNNTTAVTLTSTLFGLVFSSVSNFYKYFRNEQNLKDTVKEIGVETFKSAGHGFLSSTVANGFKFIAYKTGNNFLRNNLNSLVLANGVIDLGKSFYYFSKAQISVDEFATNVISSSALTLLNIGLNYFCPGGLLIKIASSIVLHNIFTGFMIKPKKIKEVSELKELSMINEFDNLMKIVDQNIVENCNENEKLLGMVKCLFSKNTLLLDKKTLKTLCESLHIEDAYETYNNFIDDIRSGKKIKISF